MSADQDSDRYQHETLGVFSRVFEQGWLGRCGEGGADLFIEAEREVYDEPPNPSAIVTLANMVARLGALTAQAVEAVCESRQAAMGWRPGPPVECWTVIELRLDLQGVVWINLHEYETDEYSRWLVRLNDRFAPVEVRRIPALPLQAPAAEAGTRIWASGD